MKKKCIQLCFGIILIIGGIIAVLYYNHSSSRQSTIALFPDTMTIGAQTTLQVTEATTPSEQTQGLSGVISLPPDAGMLFIFNHPDTYGFWMKEMNFPLDIIWISPGNRIVGVEKSLSPNTYPTVYYPSVAVSKVLEVNAGFFDEHNLEIGDVVTNN